MNWTGNVWNQIKNITCDELISALEKDGWVRDVKGGAVLVYYKGQGKRVTVHYHPQKTYKSPKLLKELISSIGWQESDLRKLKLIK